MAGDGNRKIDKKKVGMMGSTGDRGQGVILRDGRIPESNTYILEYL